MAIFRKRKKEKNIKEKTEEIVEKQPEPSAPRIAIISINTHTSVLNFASVLHSYVFQQFLKDNGIESTIIDYKPIFGNDILDGKHPVLYYAANQPKNLNNKNYAYNLKRWAKLFDEREVRYDKFQEFINKYYIKTDVTYDGKSITENPPDFDIYIAATDVIWSYFEGKGFDRAFLLEPFKGKKKIAYSASRGYTLSYSPEAEKDFFNCVSDFDYISVREKSLKDYIESKSNLPVKHVLDPIFLKDREFYENLAIRRKNRKNKFVLVYITMSKSTKIIENAALYAKENDMRLVEISEMPEHKNFPNGTNHKVIYGIGIEEWLGYLIDAEMIFTNSFHATALSIILHKQFVSGFRGSDKVKSLLQMFNLEERLIEEYNPERVLSLQPIDYDKVDVTREKLAKESSDFILNAIHDLENSEHQNHRDLVNEAVFEDTVNPDTTKKRIQVLLLTNRDSDNVGDQTIEQCDISLIQTAMHNLGFKDDDYIINSRAASIISKDYIKNKDAELLADAQEFIKESDIIIFGGAPLFNYDYQNFYERTAVTLEIAQQYNKPVLFSSLGIENYDDDNPKCQRLKKTLNFDCVKQITTRDDFEALKKYKENENLKIAKVPDPAVYSNAIFRNFIAEKEPDAKPKVGIFIIRGNAFKDNNIEFSKQDYTDLWENLIEELESKGYDYELLTSGHFSDEAFLDNMVRKNGFDAKHCVFGINSPENLIKKISSYSAVVSCRLHPSIIAYSLNVPSVGIVWNNKVTGFYESVGYGDRVFATENISAGALADKIDAIVKEGVKKDKEYLIKVYETLFDGIKDVIKPDSTATPYSYETLLDELPAYKGTSNSELNKKVIRKSRRAYEKLNNLQNSNDDMKKQIETLKENT